MARSSDRSSVVLVSASAVIGLCLLCIRYQPSNPQAEISDTAAPAAPVPQPDRTVLESVLRKSGLMQGDGWISRVELHSERRVTVRMTEYKDRTAFIYSVEMNRQADRWVAGEKKLLQRARL